MKHTTSLSAARQPGEAGRAEARRAARPRPARRATRRARPSRRSSRCRRRAARSPAGIRSSTHGIASRSLRTGRMTSGTGADAVAWPRPADPRHRRRRLHRLAHRRRAAGRGPRGPRARRAAATPRTASGPTTSTRAPSCIEGDVRDPDVVARARRRRDRGQPPGGDGRARRRPRRHRRLRLPQRPRHGGAAARARRPRLRRHARARLEHGRLRRGPLPLRRARDRPARARAPPEDLDAGRFEPPCPVCGRALAPEAVPEDAPLDPRNVYAATKVAQEHLCAAFARETGATVTALRYHNVYGPRMPRDTPYAGVASIFRSALAAGPRAARVRGRRAAARLRARARRRRGQRARARGRRRRARSTSPSGTPRTVGEMARRARPRRRPALAPVVTGEWRAGDVRHVFASPERAATELGLQRAPRTSRPGCASSRAAKLRA